MFTIAYRSFLVLALLFGLLFAVLMAVAAFLDLPPASPLLIALGVGVLQFALAPFIIESLYRIEWKEAAQVKPELAAFIANTCSSRGLPVPRFGVIDDGNPNAFCYGHFPSDARLVVTRGLLQKLDEPELESVVAHELGHIAHWDFVVMTVASLVPLVLYYLFRMAWRVKGREETEKIKGAATAAWVAGILAFAAYIVSQYIVLLLSRVREYYADDYSADTTNRPGALASALVKIAYGLAGAGEDPAVPQSLGIFDPANAQALAVAAASHGSLTSASVTQAMRWDLTNPWATWYEMKSTHPLPAKRIGQLEQLAAHMGQALDFGFQGLAVPRAWGEFRADLVLSILPWMMAVSLAGLGLIGFADYLTWLSLGGLALAGYGLGRLFYLRYAYPGKDFPERSVSSLLQESVVSSVRCIPATVRGQITGRGVPGFVLSEDLVLQAEDGFLILDYRQPIGLMERFFGLFKADKLIGKEAMARGWYRRSPAPYLELKDATIAEAEVIQCYAYRGKVVLAALFVVAGLLLPWLLT